MDIDEKTSMQRIVMRIGIDISQICYEGTGVANYTKDIVTAMLQQDTENTFVLFGSSLRQKDKLLAFAKKLRLASPHVEYKIYSFPPIILDMLWNRLHICPIEWFIGTLDVFWSSDWTQPPLKNSRGVTTIHDLIVYKYPDESHKKQEFSLRNLRLKSNIVETQKRRLRHVVKECQIIFCDSESTKHDVHQILHIDEKKLFVIYPGYNGR